jgi:hypothetical protein
MIIDCEYIVPSHQLEVLSLHDFARKTEMRGEEDRAADPSHGDSRGASL